MVRAGDWVLSGTAFIEAGETSTGRFVGKVARWFVPEDSTPAIAWTCIATKVSGANGGWEFIETDRSRAAAFHTYSVS